MRFLILSCLALLAAAGSKARQMEGVITYERTIDFSRLQSRLTYLTEEQRDRDRRTWGQYSILKEKYFLYFTPEKSFYTFYTDPKSNDNTWKQFDFFLTRDFGKETRYDMFDLLGKSYVLSDSLRTPKWKIMNQIKEVKGYMCMMAETFDKGRNVKITAWFAEGLGVPAGPEMYFGLPGMILELVENDGDVVITAEQIALKPVAEKMVLPRKQRGKKIDQATYERMIEEYIRDSIKARRNPYWMLRLG